MNDTDIIDGVPAVAVHLFNLARTLAQSKRPRFSALAYSAASRAPAISATQQAFALYHAAQQLFNSVRTTTDDATRTEDRTRALGYLQKAAILLRSQQSHTAFIPTMHVYALLERISTQADDHLTAAKTVDAALDTIAKGTNTPAIQLKWFCYFRSRAIANALASGNSVQHACKLAQHTAEQCEHNNDPLAAAAFYLNHAQIALGASEAGMPHLQPKLDEAATCLSQLPNAAQQQSQQLGSLDTSLIRFTYFVLRSLALIRSGDFRQLKQEVLNDLSVSYNQLRTSRRDEPQSNWKWIPAPFFSGITFYITTTVSRANCDTHSALVHAMTALTRFGITQDRIASFTLDELCHPGESQRGTLCLAVALLENAARVRLTNVSLEASVNLIAATVDLTFPSASSRAVIRSAETGEEMEKELLSSTLYDDDIDSVGIVPRCVAFALLADYHNLRGVISGAHVATSFLHAVRVIADRFSSPRARNLWLSDTWHMAVSHLSLLTGERRADLANTGIDAAAVPEAEDTDFASAFVSKQVLAHAWFSIGVYHMRKTEVLDARAAITHCLNLVHENPYGNEQIIANATVVLSGLIMMHRTISEDAASMLRSAMDLAQQLHDYVTMVRASRQNRKLVHRVSNMAEHRERIDAEHAQVLNQLAERQADVGLVFTSEDT